MKPSGMPRKLVISVLTGCGFALVLWAVGWIEDSVRLPLTLLGYSAVLAAVVLVSIGASARVRDARRRMGEQNFSWCAACHYPFDRNTPDDTMVTCSECGATFRADKARDWYREKPLRLPPE